MSAFQCISPTRAYELITKGSVQIADIRDANSFAEGRIRGAYHLNNANMGEFILQGEFEQPLIVCCYHGISSQNAAQYLASQGFEQVYSLDGGFEAWQRQHPDQTERGA